MQPPPPPSSMPPRDAKDVSITQRFPPNHALRNVVQVDQRMDILQIIVHENCRPTDMI